MFLIPETSCDWLASYSSRPGQQPTLYRLELTVLLPIRHDVVPWQIDGEPSSGRPFPHAAQYRTDQTHRDQKQHDLNSGSLEIWSRAESHLTVSMCAVWYSLPWWGCSGNDPDWYAWTSSCPSSSSVSCPCRRKSPVHSTWSPHFIHFYFKIVLFWY